MRTCSRILVQDTGIRERILSKAWRNTLASGVGSPVQGSVLAVNKIPRNGPGDNTLGVVG